MLSAIEFATVKHAKQTRRSSGLPYIIHPIRVARRLEDFVVGEQFDAIENLETLVQAAILHDTLEDTDTSYEELVRNFDTTVANLVLELTNNSMALKSMGKTNYLAEKMQNMSFPALLIKLFDRLDNISDYTVVTQREKDYAEQTLHILLHIENRTIGLSVITSQIKNVCYGILSVV